MILQNALFSAIGTDRETLYVNVEGACTSGADGLVMAEGAKVSFDTYFGAFSVDKWRRYTSLDAFSLSLAGSGRFAMEVYCTCMDEGARSTRLLWQGQWSDTCTVAIPPQAAGLVYVVLTALDGCVLRRLVYQTDAPARRDVRLCAVICTYRRESFVTDNIRRLTEAASGDVYADLSDRLLVIVVDNGNTLSPWEDARVRLVPNVNAGGAGGFTRGLMEAMALSEEYPLSHVILMDDDISFEPEVLWRTYALLSFVDAEYAQAWVSGAMLRLDRPTVQSEAADYWDHARGAVVPRKPRYDLGKVANLLANEREEEINYSSWWYCAMPIEVVREDNLPLPLFIKRDDIEYGLRNGKRFMTLLGVGVWHEPFERKRPAAWEYYYARNTLVMDFSLGWQHPMAVYRRRARRALALGVLRFRYNEVAAYMEGVRDFCRGIDWLAATDPVQTNTRVGAYNVPSVPLTTDEQGAAPASTMRGAFAKLWRLVTLNGWLFPWGKTVRVPHYLPSYTLFCGAKRAVNVDETGQNGFVTQRSWRRAFACYADYRRTMRTFGAGYHSLCKQYAQKGGTLRTISFWRAYLHLPDGPKEDAHG